MTYAVFRQQIVNKRKAGRARRTPHALMANILAFRPLSLLHTHALKITENLREKNGPGHQTPETPEAGVFTIRTL